ncbi:MAG: hypothetical protein QGI83_13060 [Candidatus Latescibacteria bacterium]|jgi:hypothetical protein|nr:hypothetical protein [Candidatus Latescibacterota bacterium]
MTARICYAFAVLILLLHLRSEARVPELLNYQGQIQTALDSVVTGTVRIDFAIYGASEGGSALWTETHSVEAIDGRFNVLLGGVTAFPEGLFSGDDLYLSLTVEDDGELSPRQRIVSSAFAIRAAQADDVARRDVHPASLTLSGGAAALDTTGLFTARRVSARVLAADSLIVGGRSVVDRDGNWTGTPISAEVSGMVLDTIIVRSVQDTIDLHPFDGQWRSLSDLRTLLTLNAPSLVDIQFTGSLLASEWLQTRMRLKSVGVQDKRTIGNTSNVLLTGLGHQASPVMNLAVSSLAPGSYILDLEYRGADPATGLGAVIEPILVVRVYK